MQKRDFIQQAVLTFLPQTKKTDTGKCDLDLAIAMSEKLWDQLTQRGYGDSKPSGQREIPKAYDQLAKNPASKAAFDLFWVAFDYKAGKDRAASRWLQLGNLSKQECDQIVQAAKQEAQARKNLPEGRVAKMAEGWLTERRWLDRDETPVDAAKKQQAQHEQKIRQVNQDLAHAKRMADDTADPYWYSEIEKLTQQLRDLREPND